MIHKTNIFAMVGGGQTPRHPKNKLMIWDDCKYVFIQHKWNVSLKLAVNLKLKLCVLILRDASSSSKQKYLSLTYLILESSISSKLALTLEDFVLLAQWKKISFLLIRLRNSVQSKYVSNRLIKKEYKHINPLFMPLSYAQMV